MYKKIMYKNPHSYYTNYFSQNKFLYYEQIVRIIQFISSQMDKNKRINENLNRKLSIHLFIYLKEKHRVVVV